MKRLLLILALLFLGSLLLAQRSRERRLPDGRLQTDLILEAEYKQNLKDATKMADLAVELRDEIESGGERVLSLESIRKAEEIEKLAKKLTKRLK